MNAIEENAILILKVSIENKLEYIDPIQIQKLTTLSPSEINDSIDFLEHIGAIKVEKIGETNPFNVSLIRIEKKGKSFYYEMMNQIIHLNLEKFKEKIQTPKEMPSDSLDNERYQTKIDYQQVCTKGHQITYQYIKNPKSRKDFCNECGSKTLFKCQNCSSPIIGCIYEIDTGYDIIARILVRDVPQYCEKCGEPFPWAQSKNSSEEKITEPLKFKVIA